MSKYPSFLVFALLSSAVWASCSFSCLPGEGDVIEEKIDLDLFEGIALDCSVDVELAYGPNQSVSIKGHKNHIDLLGREVSGGVWSIDFSENVCSEDLWIRVTLPRFTSIHGHGSGDIRSSTPLQAEEVEIENSGSGDMILNVSASEIEINLSGSGDIQLSGNSKVLELDADGSGDVQAFDLSANNAEVHADGSGDVEITVLKSLEAHAGGSGNIRYKGDPKEVSTEKDGSGDILQD